MAKKTHKTKAPFVFTPPQSATPGLGACTSTSVRKQTQRLHSNTKPQKTSMSRWRLSTGQNNRETRQTDEEVRCGLGSPGQTEKCMCWDNGKGQRCFITCGHLTAELGLLKPQPVPRAGGKEGASHCGENLPPSGVVLLCIMDLPCEPDGFPQAAPCCQCPPCRGTAALLLVQHPKEGEKLQYRDAGDAIGLSTERSPIVTWQALIRPSTCGGFAWFYLGIHSETRHGGGPPRDSVVLSVHGKVAATVRGLHSLKLPNLWLLEINTQPSSWDGLGTGQRAASWQGTALLAQPGAEFKLAQNRS